MNTVLVSWAELQVPTAPTAVTGDVAASLPALAIALAGTVPAVGVLAATLPAVAVAGSVTPRRVRASWAEIQVPTGTGATTGAAYATLPGPTVALAGAVVVRGALAATLPALTARADASSLVSARGVRVSWAELQVETPLAGATGALAATLPAIGVALAGATRARRAIVSWLELEAPDVSGAAGMVLPAPTFGAAATSTIAGTLSATLPGLACAGTGSVALTGAIAVTLPALQAGLAEGERVNGYLDTTLPAISFAADGTVPVTGDAAVTLPAVTVSATAIADTRGALAAELPAPTFSAAGIGTSAATLTAILPAPWITLTGRVSMAGNLAATLPAIAFRGSSFVLTEIAVAVTVGAPTLLLTIVSPEADMAARIKLYPSNTQPWAFRLTNRSTGDGVAGADIHVELRTAAGRVIVADADFALADMGDGDYVPNLSDAARDRVKARSYKLHVWGSASGVDFATVNDVDGGQLAAAVTAE